MHQEDKIEKTKNLMARMGYRLKFMFGKHVKVGKFYSACILNGQNLTCGKCETVFYDTVSKTLVVYDISRGLFLLCTGDMAVFQNVLYADNATICLGNREEMFQYISDYLSERNVEDIKECDVIDALRHRFCRVPTNYLTILARCYVAKKRSFA